LIAASSKVISTSGGAQHLAHEVREGARTVALPSGWRSAHPASVPCICSGACARVALQQVVRDALGDGVEVRVSSKSSGGGNEVRKSNVW
jgi:hypothetical protein